MLRKYLREKYVGIVDQSGVLFEVLSVYCLILSVTSIMVLPLVMYEYGIAGAAIPAFSALLFFSVFFAIDFGQFMRFEKDTISRNLDH